MKKFLPLILLAFPTATFGDVTHSIQSVASVSTLGASATTERLAASISVSGTNVTPKANDTANLIGSLDLADAGIANGVPTIDYDTSFTVTNSGDAFSVSETYLQGDSTSTTASTVTNGVAALPLLGKYTVVSGGDPGSVAITLDSGQGLSASLADMGSGTSVTLQSTITLGLD